MTMQNVTRQIVFRQNVAEPYFLFIRSSYLLILFFGFRLDIGWIWVGYGLDMGWIWVGYGLDMGWKWVGYGLDMGWIWVGYG